MRPGCARWSGMWRPSRTRTTCGSASAPASPRPTRRKCRRFSTAWWTILSYCMSTSASPTRRAAWRCTTWCPPPATRSAPWERRTWTCSTTPPIPPSPWPSMWRPGTAPVNIPTLRRIPTLARLTRPASPWSPPTGRPSPWFARMWPSTASTAPSAGPCCSTWC